MTDTEFSYQAVSDEVKEIFGESYPKDELFSAAEIDAAVAELSDYYLTEEVASLTGKEHPPIVLKRFAELADALRLPVVLDSYGLKLKRDTSLKQRRDSAISHLKGKEDSRRRKIARESLERKSLADV